MLMGKIKTSMPQGKPQSHGTNREKIVAQKQKEEVMNKTLKSRSTGSFCGHNVLTTTTTVMCSTKSYTCSSPKLQGATSTCTDSPPPDGVIIEQRVPGSRVLHEKSVLRAHVRLYRLVPLGFPGYPHLLQLLVQRGYRVS